METYSSPDHVELIDQKIELQGATLIHLNEIRKWTHFLSVLGFVAVGLLFFVGILLLVTHSANSAMQLDQFGFLSPWIGISYIVFAAIYFIPVLFLFRFSILAKHSLLQLGSVETSSELMARAFLFLKKHFRFVGIFTIGILVVYMMVVIGLIIAYIIK